MLGGLDISEGVVVLVLREESITSDLQRVVFTNLGVKLQNLAPMLNMGNRKENCPGCRVGGPRAMAVGGIHNSFVPSACPL